MQSVAYVNLSTVVYDIVIGNNYLKASFHSEGSDIIWCVQSIYFP